MFSRSDTLTVVVVLVYGMCIGMRRPNSPRESLTTSSAPRPMLSQLPGAYAVDELKTELKWMGTKQVGKW